MAEPPGAPGVEFTASAAESIALVRDSEADRLLQPVRYGGRAVSPAEFVAAVADLAARDGSAGWLSAAVNAAAYAVAGLGDAAAERVWSADAAAVVTAGAEPAGRLTADRGQFRLTGRWESVTGARIADWLLLAALDGKNLRYVLVPHGTAQVDGTTGLHGLDAAAIGDVTVSDAVVDRDAVFAAPDDTAWDSTEFGDRPTYPILAGAGQAAAVVGAADGVWQAHVGQVRRRLGTSYGSEDTTELTSSAVLVATAESDIDAALLQVVTALHAPDATGAATALRQAVTRARNAADQLLSSGSRHALDVTDPATRLWFDVLAGYRLTVRGVETPAVG
ncbi:hypothetical protein OF855_12910 [Mycolicibacterium fortuitum]|uniref:hypothetical protein n=1 Tax=Mycolicibacterium fortuitum TaxID=1766 RepID=UPI0022BA308A|nr:hypothetical protein [Mycolicibacterium fortuitum]WAY21899.1 hypothetical protein OF855_12910 [Mycolicibacterium fortuitum]